MDLFDNTFPATCTHWHLGWMLYVTWSLVFVALLNYCLYPIFKTVHRYVSYTLAFLGVLHASGYLAIEFMETLLPPECSLSTWRSYTAVSVLPVLFYALLAREEERRRG